MKGINFLFIGVVVSVAVAITVFSIYTQANADFASIDKEIIIDLSQSDIPLDAKQRIDYDKLVKIVSESQFEKLLEGKNVLFDSDDIVLLNGPQRSVYTEQSGICGYVVAKNQEDYWLESYLNVDTLTKVRITNENPMPCQPNTVSCFCSAQIHMVENTVDKLFYLTSSEEENIGKAVRSYLDTTHVSNVSDKFIVGKYNIESDFTIVPYCGQFIGDKREIYFEGYIQFSNVIDFGLEFKKPKLCAINDDDPQIFGFK